MRLFVLVLCWRILMQDIGNIEQLCPTVNTELVALSVLFTAAIPATLITLMINCLVHMLLRLCAEHLGDFIASKQGCANCQGGEISGCLWLAMLVSTRLGRRVDFALFFIAGG